MTTTKTPAPHHPSVIECVNAIMTQARIGEEFRADFEKYVAAVHTAGASDSRPHVHSEPLTHDEIHAVRESLKVKTPRPAKAKK